MLGAHDPIHQTMCPTPRSVSCRGKEKHITSLGLKRIVYSITEKKDLEPLSPSIASFVHPITDTTPRPLSPSPWLLPHSNTNTPPIHAPQQLAAIRARRPRSLALKSVSL